MQGDRAEQRAPDPAASTTADHQQAGVVAQPDEVLGGRARHHRHVHLRLEGPAAARTSATSDVSRAAVAERSVSTRLASSSRASAQ